MPSQTPAKLFVENDAELVATLAARLARNRYVGQLRTVSEFELRAMIDRILSHCGSWSDGNEYELTACANYLDNICFVLSIALIEAAYALYVIRDGIVDMLPCNDEPQRSDRILRVNRFFEALVREILRKY